MAPSNIVIQEESFSALGKKPDAEAIRLKGESHLKMTKARWVTVDFSRLAPPSLMIHHQVGDNVAQNSGTKRLKRFPSDSSLENFPPPLQPFLFIPCRI